MGKNCNIIRDILPLYAENMVSLDTVSFVEEHLENCEACRNEYEQMKEDEMPSESGTGLEREGKSKKEPQSESRLVSTRAEVAPLLKLKKKMMAKEIQTVTLTAVFIIIIFISVFAILDTPEYVPYSEGLLQIEPMEEGGIKITFDDSVTDFQYIRTGGADDLKRDYYLIEAWSSPLATWFSGRWFSSRGELSFKIYPEGELPISLMYVPNNGEENICVYGETDDFDGMVSLPGLVLGYYLIFAMIVFTIMLVVWLFVRKKVRLRAWVERVMLYPVAYVISHLVIVGFTFETYSAWRDFMLIVPISILLYCGMLLVHGIWRLRKEIREINSQRWRD